MTIKNKIKDKNKKNRHIGVKQRAKITCFHDFDISYAAP